MVDISPFTSQFLRMKQWWMMLYFQNICMVFSVFIYHMYLHLNLAGAMNEGQNDKKKTFQLSLPSLPLFRFTYCLNTHEISLLSCIRLCENSFWFAETSPPSPLVCLGVSHFPKHECLRDKLKPSTSAYSSSFELVIGANDGVPLTYCEASQQR